MRRRYKFYSDYLRSIISEVGKPKKNFCALSGLPLKTGDPVVIIPLIETETYRYHPIKIYRPIALPVFGKYSPTVGLRYCNKPDRGEKIMNSVTELILESLILFPGKVKRGRIRKRWSSFIEMIQKQPGGHVPACIPGFIDYTRLNYYHTYDVRLAMIHKEIYLDMINACRVAWSEIPSSYFLKDGNELRVYRSDRNLNQEMSTKVGDLFELLGRFYYQGLTGGRLDIWDKENRCFLYNYYFTSIFSSYHFDGTIRLAKRYEEALRYKQIKDDFSIKLLIEQFKDLWILDHIMGYLRKPWCKGDLNYDEPDSVWLSPEILLKFNEVVSKFIKTHYPINGDLDKENLYRHKTHGTNKKPV